MDRERLKRWVLRHIINNGDDSNLRDVRWAPIKLALWEEGLLERRVKDWRWVPTSRAHEAGKS